MDVYALNSVTKVNMRAGQMQVDPPMLGPMELRRRMNIRPGGRTWTTAPGQANEVKPLVTGINYPVGVDREMVLGRFLS